MFAIQMKQLIRNIAVRIYFFIQYSIIDIFRRIRKDDRRIFYVDPNAVLYTISPHDPSLYGNRVLHFGEVKPGDWDLNGFSINEYGGIYSILKRRIEGKVDYGEIPEFLDNMEKIEQGEPWDNCTTRDGYYKKWQEIESLYQEIKNVGYKTQIELKTGKPLNEIRIQIGRSGNLLFEEGLHRLIIAQLLNLKQVPVLISRRHKEWAKLRQDVIRIVAGRGFFHQPFNHPDLDCIPEWYGNHLKDQAMYGNERWDQILSHLPVRKGSVLDIGAYFGYFCHRFEDMGFECYAVEPNRHNLAVLKRYRKMMKKSFHVWERSLFEIDRFDFNIVLALNVFHHLVGEKGNYERLIQFLKNLKCQGMFFEPSQSPQENAYKSFSNEGFVDFVLENSSLTTCKLIGRAKENRSLYLLTP